MNSIVEAVKNYAETRPERIAVIADGVKVTYEEFWKEIQGIAAYIRSFSFEKQSRIIVKADQDIWFAAACLAIHLSGHVHVPLEKSIGEKGLEDVARQLHASMVIADIPAAGDFVLVDSAKIREIGRENYREDISFELPERDMLCDILFTTGTTGKSKGVMLSHKAVVAVAENIRYGVGIIEDNVYLMPVPINHAGGIRKMYVTMLTGTTLVLMDGFTDVKKFFSYIEEYGVTSIVLPPAAVRMLLVLSGKQLQKYSGQLHHIHTGAAAFPEADKERLSALLPETKLFFAYGSSEAGCSCMFDYTKYPGQISCVGKANCNSNVFIVDDERRPMQSSADNQGFLAISGDTVMNGYFEEPELTKEVLLDNVIYTNDLGYIDENGFIYMTGRRGDVINIGGLKIAPAEVEDVVLRYPGIAECACFALQDRMGGSVPKLNIVVEEGIDVNVSELKKFMAEHLESYKIPKTIAKVDEIPKTFNGKIDRKKLQ